MEVKNSKALPQRIERRLAELVALNEFDQEEVEQCRKTYWDDRDGWHSVLIGCYERAQQRQEAGTEHGAGHTSQPGRITTSKAGR